jgi:hypothetical protein
MGTVPIRIACTNTYSWCSPHSRTETADGTGNKGQPSRLGTAHGPLAALRESWDGMLAEFPSVIDAVRCAVTGFLGTLSDFSGRPALPVQKSRS